MQAFVLTMIIAVIIELSGDVGKIADKESMHVIIQIPQIVI